jgi:RNA recognition motif-containing protein
MFIGGLNWETTDRKSQNSPIVLELVLIVSIESLKDYFTQFGEVTECTVMRDGTTGRSRGFGFLTFKDPKVVNVVMVKEHLLDGKLVSVPLGKSHLNDWFLTALYRSTPSALSHAMNRRRPPRSSLVV